MTHLGADLANTISKRIHQCRNVLSGITQYLQYPSSIEPEDYDVYSDLFVMPRTAQIRKIVGEHVERLDDSDDSRVMSAAGVAVMNVSGTDVNSNESEVVQALTWKALSVEEEMDLVIRNSTCKQVRSTSTRQNLVKVILTGDDTV